jgi:hypothetical protein
VGADTAVEYILLQGADAQIAPAVVCGIAVDMVHNGIVRRVHDLAVHEDQAAVLPACGVEAPAAGTARGKPFVLVEPFKVGGVNDGVLAFGQGELKVRGTFVEGINGVRCHFPV